MNKVRQKINADDFQFWYSDTNEEEIKCLLGLLYFRGLYHDTKQSKNTFSSRNAYQTQEDNKIT